MPKSCFGPKRPLIQRSFPLIPLIPFGLHSSLMLLLPKSSLQSNSFKSCVQEGSDQEILKSEEGSEHEILQSEEGLDHGGEHGGRHNFHQISQF